MKLKYDEEDDVLVITLKEEPLSYGEEISEDIIVHYSGNDELVEVEILDASEIFRSERELVIPEKVGTKE